MSFPAPEGLSVHQAFVVISFHSHKISISLLWHVRHAVGFFIEFAREGYGGLNAESAFKPTHCTSLPAALCALLCLCLIFQGDWPSCLLRTMLLKRDTGFLNVSPRREPYFPLCSFFLCECYEVAHECDSVMESLRQLHCRNIEGTPT